MLQPKEDTVTGATIAITTIMLHMSALNCRPLRHVRQLRRVHKNKWLVYSLNDYCKNSVTN